MKNQVYLWRKNKIVVEHGSNDLPVSYLAAALRNIESLGYTFSLELLERIRTLSEGEFFALYSTVVSVLKEKVGASRRFKPMYPNFPKQVMEANDGELYLQAIRHYLTWKLPVHEVKKRLPLLKESRLKLIELGTDEELLQVGMNLLRAKSSLSVKDKEDLEVLLQECTGIAEALPPEIPHKENVAIVASILLKHDKLPIDFFANYCKTATDVLRIAVALSDGDVSLAAPTKFRKFRRSERRLLLRLLEASPNLIEDMLRYKNRWIRLGEILHPFEYQDRYPKTAEAFDALRNNHKIETMGSKVEQALVYGDVAAAVQLLGQRPGEFARRLDHLLRISENGEVVLESFAKIAASVSTPVLLQVMNHFVKREAYGKWRTFFPKGEVAKVQAIPNTLVSLEEPIRQRAATICREVLMQRFAALPPLGKVFIDPRLHEHLVPFSQRSASKALRTLVRGSRIAIPEGGTIRFFTWWREGQVNGMPTGRVDVDLSAVLYNAKWKYLEHISYTNLRSAKYQAYHSGDIVEAPNGACEFIDLDMESIIRYGGRYVVMSLNSFTNQPYCDLPECYAGWMIRTEPQSGEIFEPQTVQDKVDLASNTSISIPVILDLVERKVIWTDVALRSHPRFVNNVEANSGGMQWMGKALTTLVKPTLHELFSLHVEARGTRTDQEENADTVFSLETGITPFDTEIIMADFL
ncbi:TerD family protein [Brevibacillus reuszeri]|uniref:TerD family protein n=1 Tax=Brevibacillus reuszeri TaxID=54915 RepID=UPI000CCC51DB|nr:TerD family protein [Brevibacillus reuszeri]